MALLPKNDLQLKSSYGSSPPCTASRRAFAMFSPHTLQYTASHGKTLHTLQGTATHCNTLQCTAAHCNTIGEAFACCRAQHSQMRCDTVPSQHPNVINHRAVPQRRGAVANHKQIIINIINHRAIPQQCGAFASTCSRRRVCSCCSAERN